MLPQPLRSPTPSPRSHQRERACLQTHRTVASASPLRPQPPRFPRQLCAQNPPFMHKLQSKQQTLCTKYQFRTQTSAPQHFVHRIPLSCTKRKEADLLGQPLSVSLLSAWKIISMLLHACAGMLQEVCPLQPLQPYHSRSSPYPEVQSSMHTVSCPLESCRLCKRQTKLRS